MTRLASLSLIFGALSAPIAAAGPRDEAQIRALQLEQADAWNRHDIEAYADLFTPDADVVNVLGWHWTSRAELQRKLGLAFRSVFARSTLSIMQVAVEFPRRDVAVAHVRWSMSGASSPTASATDTPAQGIQTQVLLKRNGRWRISHFQNTNSVPERDFPPPS